MHGARRKQGKHGGGRRGGAGAGERRGGSQQARDARAMRLKVWHQTVEAVERGSFLWRHAEEVALPVERMLAGVARNEQLSLEALRQEPVAGGSGAGGAAGAGDTPVRVVGGDCLVAALELQDRGLNPLVLNMASRKHPGGGVERGAGAQEENLHRRSNYFQHLKNPQGLFQDPPARYPMGHTEGIYSPDVCVFRGPEDARYAFLEEPRFVSMVAVAAVSQPALDASGARLAADVAALTADKVRVMLLVGAQRGHDSLVLSAFGCGAYRNPPAHVAEIFRAVLAEERFRGRFREVVFAIIEDHNSRLEHNPDGNAAPFAEAFGVSMSLLGQ